MAEHDLLSCPFCGEELEFSENLSIHGGGWMHHGDEANRDKPCFLVGKIVYNTPGDLDRWNRRVSAPDQTNAEVSDERLRELLPCPFCGRAPDTSTGPKIGTDIYCAHDDCGGGRIHVGPDETDRHGLEAIARWNRRSVTSQASEGEIEALIEGLRQIGNAGHNPALTGTQHEALMRAINFLHRASPSKRVERLEEWKAAIIGLCVALGSDAMPWGGDKTGWGFIHYFVKHLHTRAITAEAALEKLRSYNVDIAAERINYRPHDHIAVIDQVLQGGRS